MQESVPTKLKLIAQTNAEWKGAFNEGLYTGPIMLDYLIHKVSLKWDDILEKGFVKNSTTKQPQLDALPHDA